jgi:hypothetical protein
MNHTILATVGILATIISALTGTSAISIMQTAAAQNDNATDIENSGTNSKFKQKEKNNCTGFTNCCNVASQSLDPPPPIRPCIIPLPPPPNP